MIAALRSAGATPHDPPGGATDKPFPAIVRIFDVKLGNRKLVVDIGASWPIHTDLTRKMPPPNSLNCSIRSDSNEDASVAAVRHWVAIAPSSESKSPHNDEFAPDTTLSHFAFQWSGRDNDARQPWNGVGEGWSIDLMSSPKDASVQLMHFLSDDKGVRKQ
jgi:hypothetical protein